MSIRLLLAAFERLRQTGEPMVLATVVETIGSTYSKAGAQMLVAANGESHGLLSGGCLEGDLIAHARSVLDTGQPKQVTYDTRDRSEDELWGLGLGCDGLIRIFLQPLLPDEDYAPFGAIARRVDARIRAGYALVVQSTLEGLVPGMSVVVDDTVDGMTETHSPWPPLAHAAGNALTTGRATLERVLVDDRPVTLLAAPVPLPVRLLLLGGGPDAAPLVRLARELGWHLTVADHRQGYIERISALEPDEALKVTPARLADALDPASFDAAVIMSHHLPSDRLYLAAIAPTPIRYIGLLGPPARRVRLLEETGLAAALGERLHGPVGLDIGARSPEGIALAIAAEVHAVLAGHDGGHLADKPL